MPLDGVAGLAEGLAGAKIQNKFMEQTTEEQDKLAQNKARQLNVNNATKQLKEVGNQIGEAVGH